MARRRQIIEKIVNARENKMTLKEMIEFIFHVSLWVLALIGAFALGIIAIIYFIALFLFFAMQKD